MNIKALQGYILAFSFLEMYKQEHKDLGDLTLIDNHIQIMMRKHKRNKISFESLLSKGWNFFDEYCGKKEAEMSVLAFILQLIIKNPNKDKNKALTNLAIQINKKELFSKDEAILNAKILVNRFYGLIKE